MSMVEGEEEGTVGAIQSSSNGTLDRDAVCESSSPQRLDQETRGGERVDELRR